MIQQMLAQKTAVNHAVNNNTETLALSRKARRLFVGNIPGGMGLSDQQIAEFFNMACRESGIAIMPGEPVIGSWLSPEGKYGFIEFRSIDETTAALALNGISLQGRQLVVKRPNDYEPAPEGIPTGVALTAPAANAAPATVAGTLGAMPGLPGGMPAAPAAPAPAENLPTSVLVLSNMVTVEELHDDQDFEDIVLDTKEECEKFGTVVKVTIPRPAADGSAVAGLGKVFVEFDCKESAAGAKDALHGRLFDNRTVIGTYADEKKFAAGDLSEDVGATAAAMQF